MRPNEPHVWWEIRDAEDAAGYAAMVEGKTCLDCGLCVQCEEEGHEDVGWCLLDGEFRTSANGPEADGLECFRGR